MKKLITILIMCFCCSVFGAKAQEVQASDYYTTTLNDARFEFLSSDNFDSYLLDKYTGKVWRKEKDTFVEIEIKDAPSDTSNQVTFQLYLQRNNVIVRLLNVRTGEVWDFHKGIFQKTPLVGALGK